MVNTLPNKKIKADIAKSGQRRLIWCYVSLSNFKKMEFYQL
mgnify:CR=1 FL=1